jgi:SAM-dependent MidA family methyltransferase
MAMERALYGPGGFYVSGDRPYRHFRTSVHAAPLFAGAVAELLLRVDRALGGPPRLDLVDVGAGRGELLVALLSLVPDGVRARLRPVAVEVSPRPAALPAEVDWRADLPERVTGLLLATEWLDNVPLDLAALGDDGVVRYVEVSGDLGDPVSDVDRRWLDRWWPLTPGSVAEVGVPRDEAWRAAVSTVERGLALAVDYGHLRDGRPLTGTLTGFRAGRQVPPVPDGDCDLTAHVAFDALATPTSTLLAQREALHRLGVSGARPPLALASTDPAAYVRALAAAGAAAELTDPAGLGGHLWLLQPVAIQFLP